MSLDLGRELAERLLAARRDGRQIHDLPPGLVPGAASDAYAINGLVAEGLAWEPLGWKIAATTEAVRDKLGVSEPIYGRTFRRFALRSPARVPHRELLDPLAECEFFVTLGRDLPARDKPWRMEEVIDAVSGVEAGIEVAECRFPAASIPPLTAVLADGSASGRYVFGDPLPDWRRDGVLAGMRVVMEVDGVRRREGVGAAVMGHPLRPLLWLAEERRRVGDGLRAGETVSTGSTTGMFRVLAGQRIRAVFGDVAEVRIDFDG